MQQFFRARWIKITRLVRDSIWFVGGCRKVRHCGTACRGLDRRTVESTSPTSRDAVATLPVVAIVILLGSGAHQMIAPFIATQQPRISFLRLSYRSTLPHDVAHAGRAGRLSNLHVHLRHAGGQSRRAETVLIPLLDVLQSARAGLCLLHGRVLRLAFSRHFSGAGACSDLRDLYGPSVERN